MHPRSFGVFFFVEGEALWVKLSFEQVQKGWTPGTHVRILCGPSYVRQQLDNSVQYVAFFEASLSMHALISC